MVQFGALLSSAGRRLDRILVLAFVPFVVGLASPSNFARVAAVSLVATPLFTTSVPGAIAGTAVLAPVCVLFNAATMLFLAGLDGGAEAGAGTPGHWDADARAVQAPSSSSNSPVDM